MNTSRVALRISLSVTIPTMESSSDTKTDPMFFSNMALIARVQEGDAMLWRFILRHRVVGWMPISAAVAERFHWFRLRASYR